MAVEEQVITERYALYLADCIEAMQSLPDQSVHLSVYSPPFGGLYHYSSSERDLSNCDDYGKFFEHYEFVVREIERLTLPGRMTAVHCMDVPTGNSGCDALIDFPATSSDCMSVSAGDTSRGIRYGRSRWPCATGRCRNL